MSNNWIAWTVCVSIIVTVSIICLASIANIQAYVPCMASSNTLPYEPYSRNKHRWGHLIHKGICISIWQIYICIKTCVCIHMYVCIYTYEIYMSYSLIFPRTEIAWRSKGLWRIKGNGAMNSLIPSTPNYVALTHTAHALKSGLLCLPPWHTGVESCLVSRPSQIETATQTWSIWVKEGGTGNLLWMNC